jgi:hypothetical protein
MAIAARVETFIHFGPSEPEAAAGKLLNVAVYVGENVYLSPKRVHHVVEELLEGLAVEKKRYWNIVVPEEGVPIFGPYWAEAFAFPGRSRSVGIYADPPEALVTRLTNRGRVIK